MPGPEFHQTRMGQKFYEHDVPTLINLLKRIAIALENKGKEETNENTEGEY